MMSRNGIAVWVCLILFACAGYASAAADTSDKGQSKTESSVITEEDRKIVGKMEVLELMDLLADVEFMKELDLFLKEETHEKND